MQAKKLAGRDGIFTAGRMRRPIVEVVVGVGGLVIHARKTLSASSSVNVLTST